MEANNSLKNLRSRVDHLIQQLGEDAPCAAFIFTHHDVFTWQEENNQQVLTDRETAADILNSIENDYDSLYQNVFDCIDGELRERGLTD